ncbi:hypothetical protein [Burkholderia multivorans]|uniref:hypothetical protein n=1 Tax=Burkholderia multivorans TaxID=87883 RepID=UPI0015E2C4A4|nr:hypothetical protein [Burkholderia multivorans]
MTTNVNVIDAMVDRTLMSLDGIREDLKNIDEMDGLEDVVYPFSCQLCGFCIGIEIY